MKKHLKTIVTSLLIFSVLFALVGCGNQGELTFDFIGYEYTVTECDQDATVLNIPSVYEGYPVTSIGERAFALCQKLTKVNIPDSITSIGNSAFYSCGSLLEVTIGSGITEISDYCFSGCNDLTSITIPNNVKKIGSHAFEGCTSLTTIRLPKKISMDMWSFKGCQNLVNIYYEGTKDQWLPCGYEWNKDVPALYVICTDGRVSLQ